MDFGQYHGGLVRKRSSAGFRLLLGCVAGARRDSSAQGLLLEKALLQLLRGFCAVLNELLLGAGRVQAGR